MVLSTRPIKVKSQPSVRYVVALQTDCKLRRYHPESEGVRKWRRESTLTVTNNFQPCLIYCSTTLRAIAVRSDIIDRDFHYLDCAIVAHAKTASTRCNHANR